MREKTNGVARRSLASGERRDGEHEDNERAHQEAPSQAQRPQSFSQAIPSLSLSRPLSYAIAIR